MQIANIATQAAAVSQGGTPVKMDNSSILGKIHKNAQAKKDAWIKQMLDYKEKQDDNAYKMYTLGLKEKEIDLNALDKQARRQYENQKLAIDKALAENKITASQHQMMLGQAKLDAMIANNNTRNAIAQQRANTYTNRNVAEKVFLNNYRHYNINGNDYVIPRTQQTILAGYLIDYINDAKNAKLKKGISENLKKYLEGQTAEQTKKDAKQAELFIAQALGEIGKDVANVIINKNLRANDETSRAYLQLYANGYIPIANEATEREKESETDNDELEKRAN